MLEFKITNYKDEIDNVRENYESLRADFEEMKKENEFLKKANISLEKENHILQNNMDKVNRLFEKASAESVRYKSVVDLQKSALTELQRDLNRTTIDYVPNGSLVSDMMPVISYKNNSRLLQTAKSADYEKDIFDTNNFDPKIDHINPYVKEISDLGDFKPLQKKSLQNSPNRNLVAYYSSRDAKKRFQNLSNHIFDSNRENQSHLLNKGKLLMERTFDHTTNLYNLSESKHISLTEDNISKPRKGIINYAPKQHPLMGEALQKKRASTEQLMHVSPGNSSPEVTTEKTESFVSTSTIINPPDLHDSDFRNKHKQDLVARAMSRRESRVLIQPLPRLFTKSKYEGFRQAKSSERREYNSSRDNLLTATTKYFSPKETNDRDSMNQKHDKSDKSHLEVPHHCENSGCRL